MRIWATLSALLAVGFFSLAVFLPRAINTALDDGISDAITIVRHAISAGADFEVFLGVTWLTDLFLPR
jgi:hypothetical protein